jgi:gluconokinase
VANKAVRISLGTKERMMRRDRQPQRVWSAAIAHTITRPVIAVVMGISGSGKTTVSALLAAALGCQFQEGDDLHPAANVEKMHGGTPLTDADRLPWLRKIAEEIDGWRARGESGVLTCSALKRSYRDIIIGDRPGVTLVYLKGSYDLIRRRMTARHEHFMPVAADEAVRSFEVDQRHPRAVADDDVPVGTLQRRPNRDRRRDRASARGTARQR